MLHCKFSGDYNSEKILKSANIWRSYVYSIWSSLSWPTLYKYRRPVSHRFHYISAHLWHLWFLCAAYKCTYLLFYLWHLKIDWSITTFSFTHCHSVLKDTRPLSSNGLTIIPPHCRGRCDWHTQCLSRKVKFQRTSTNETRSVQPGRSSDMTWPQSYQAPVIRIFRTFFVLASNDANIFTREISKAHGSVVK